MERIQRKRTKGWKMPANTKTLINDRRHTYNLCLGQEDDKKNITASPAKDSLIENQYSVAPNQNTNNIIGQDAIGITLTDAKGEQKQEKQELFIQQKSLKQERQETNGTSQTSKPNFSKDSEKDVQDADLQIKEHSKSTISTVVATKSESNLAGNTLKQSQDSPTENSERNTKYSVQTATKSNATPVRGQD